MLRPHLLQRDELERSKPLLSRLRARGTPPPAPRPHRRSPKTGLACNVLQIASPVDLLNVIRPADRLRMQSLVEKTVMQEATLDRDGLCRVVETTGGPIGLRMRGQADARDEYTPHHVRCRCAP